MQFEYFISMNTKIYDNFSLSTRIWMIRRVKKTSKNKNTAPSLISEILLPPIIHKALTRERRNDIVIFSAIKSSLCSLSVSLRERKLLEKSGSAG